MSIALTLIISLAAALCGNITKKYYIDKESPAGASGGLIFNAVGNLSAAVILLFWGGIGSVSAFTAILGTVFGAATALQGVTNIAALQVGPMSYTSVIISFSTLISALSGVLLFDESLAWAQAVGIVLMLASFVLAAKDGGNDKRANIKWLLLCLSAFAATGGIGVMQKVHQSSDCRDELNAFLIIAFVSSAVLCLIFTVFSSMRNGRSSDASERSVKNKKQLWLSLAIMLASGVCVAVNNKLNLYLSGVMDSAVFFPIVNGGGLVLTTLAAVVLFKERLSKKQWLGVVIGILSVLFLCDPLA